MKFKDSPVILVLNIEAQKCVLDVVIREETHIPHVHEIVMLYADFKVYSKKFKEIFLKYMKSMH